MSSFLKSKLIMALVSISMISAAITILLAGSILHSHPTHAQSPTWTATGNILLPRYRFRATTLPNGQVLLEGGFASGSYTTDSELFDPTTGVWTESGSLNQGRGEHSATLLQNGQVLVAGGYAGPVLNSAELYNPATETWTLTGSMRQVRTRHTATLLQNGRVLVAGGWNGSPISGAELYNSVTGSWSSAGNMLIPRADGAAVLLPNGKVLVAGGDFANSNGFTAESELYNPATKSWSATGSMNVARGGEDAILLPDGQVLVMGGSASTGAPATAELYNPKTGTWTLTGSMQEARSLGLGMQALLLANGTVLVAGGDTTGTSEVYNPATGTWGSLTNMTTPHCGGVTAPLSNGQLLIAGGSDCVSSNLTTVTELYEPSSTPITVPNTSWAGYAASGSLFPDPSQPATMLYSDVKGSWQVPTATCPKGQPSSKVAFWVGLGGTQRGLEQIGILIQCNGSTGALTYNAVYEIINGKSGTVVSIRKMDPSDVVKPNDPISAEVSYLGSRQYQLLMTDSNSSAGWSFTSPVLYGSAGTAALDAADWITEAPLVNGQVQPLTQFTTVNFSNCEANGDPISISPTINQFLMTVDGSITGSQKATPSSLDSTSTGFSVTWVSSGP